MRNLIWLILAVILVSACQTERPFNSGLAHYRDYHYLPIRDEHDYYKVFVAAHGVNQGYVSKFTKGSDLEQIIEFALEQCHELRVEYRILNHCKVEYLGNTRIVYSNDSELDMHVETYKQRLLDRKDLSKVAELPDKFVCDYAYDYTTEKWSINFPTAVDEAKKRNLDCSGFD